MKIHKLLLSTACALVATAGISSATSLGLLTDPMGNGWQRGDANSAYAIWDTFGSYAFTDVAANTSAGFSSVGLSQSTQLLNPDSDQGAGVYSNIGTQTPGNDAVYTGGRGASFSVEGNVSFTIQGIVLQIKRSQSSGSFAGDVSPLLNGSLLADSVVTLTGSGDTNSANGLYSITTYYWNASIASLNLSSFDIAFSIPMHRGVDAIVLDVGSQQAEVIPEPSTYALIVLGAVVLLFRLRKKAVFHS